MSATDFLQHTIHRAPVVVFHSPLTDLGDLPALVDNRSASVHYVTLGMGSAAERARFHELSAWTGHATLPQVFVDGRFLGGLEAARRAFAHRLDEPARRAGLWLGYAGMLPFAVGAALCWTSASTFGALWVLAYAAVILSFVGAVHWGLGLSAESRAAPLITASVVPALVAWAALLLPAAGGMALCLVAFLAWRAWERRGPPASLPPWFERLRNHLTAGAVVSLAIGWLAVVL